ncbi:MAG: tRNA (5-methylaminomethyl-2-thiouridine)(34)-methyltransferase MnmD [Bacteroidaceae bacterium]|nr:tRNA (5-methylaminomethyl-2-thiouridine)(34)-methyltransferase MnmD [Bacteroidaceae bacterium]
MRKVPTTPIIEYTEDGSTTLFIEDMNEHYHSTKGAITESNHIYRDCAFLHRHSGNTIPLRLLEIGFGTGLNACVTALVADEKHPVHYISLEKYPIETELLSQLNYQQWIDKALFNAIHAAPWEKPIAITPHFTLEKRQTDFLTAPLPQQIDIVYFDAFAPEKQPEMWGCEVFEKLFHAMNPGATLTTYCAKGEIRRMLTSIGLIVERIAGPIGGKREILRAIKP